jgi:5'-deoxynucleotidase YfbR-like HD superfamily hydrolase
MTNVIEDINKFKNIQKLKFTYRFSWRTIDWEKESTADHTRCCFMIADYLLAKLNVICSWKYNLDKLKIYEIISYHDLIETETWDIDLSPIAKDKHWSKIQNEKEILPFFLEKIPNELKEIYKSRLTEYEERMSLDSKFVKLVDTIEWQFQVFFHKHLFKEWSEKYRISKIEKHFKDFPELKFIYIEMLEYYKNNDYFFE